MAVYSKFNDHELTVLLKQEDRLAFTEIYNRYWAEMYYHAFKILKDEEGAKDVVQDIFSNLWLKSSALHADTKLSGHLYITVRNKVFNLIAQNKVRSDYLTSIAAYMTEEVAESSLLDEKELMELVEAEIRNLPPKMREIFELSRKEGLSHKEIAKKLGLSDQTVKKQIQNALKVLKPKIRVVEAGFFVLLFMR